MLLDREQARAQVTFRGEPDAIGGPDYYENWLGALETLLVSSGRVTSDDVSRRAAEYRALERDPVF